MKLAHPRSWSLSFKLPLTISLAVAGVALTIGLTLTWQEFDRARSQLEERALSTAGAIAAIVPEDAIRRDYWSLYKALQKMAAGATTDGNEITVVGGMILDPRGMVLAHLDPARNPLGKLARDVAPMPAAVQGDKPSVRWVEGAGPGYVEGSVPILSQSSIIGVVHLRLSTAHLDRRTWMAMGTIMGLTFLLGAIGSIVGTVISRRMIRPLTALADGLETLGRGEPALVRPVAIHDMDEIGRLAASFNRVTAELTEKKRLEQELATSEKLAALGRIAAGVAHEVNNPLAGMLTCIDTMKSHPDDPELPQRYMPLLDKGLHRIQAIVQGLLAELRAETDDPPRGTGCLEDLRDLLQAEIGDRPVDLVWSVTLPTDLCFQCRRIHQVILNLLRNGLQALPHGGVLSLRASLIENEMVVEVEDNGIGIPADAMTRLFDPFFTTKATGTGLGLWITYRLVQGLHGSIEVESEPGLGSLFRIRVPVLHDLHDLTRGVA